ncbi:hypothetical protein PMG11_09421 [Penicillium brasilianum]|uniref:Xylanolytic transcriptional activator regulatory domain-containing protein n=1 Tax=Penicillium brasilianum TaxID=104259 RepID=A0A0F7TZI9_PENBI|nr:hypothetical protein PMG11_09421 [Penicillium brasilianum]
MRNAFYKRAKILYDFGVEEDLLCRSQAAGLLSYESSASDISGNSTWLALAIQHARTVNAHLYDQLPETGSYSRSSLKRLWWSLILRDRVIALGMRRPLQILTSHFDVSLPDNLNTQDFEDMEHHSNVYNLETKCALRDVFLAQCRLAIALTPVIMTIYPPGYMSGSPKDLVSTLARAEDVKTRLQYWRSQHAFVFSTAKSETHPSVTLFKQLTALYYESGRLTLHHHIAFWLYQSRRLQRPSKLLDAVTSINSILKRFVIDGTANHLPISVVAFTILPQMLMTFSLRLSHGSLGHQQQQYFSKIYEELNKLHRLRYDVSHVSSWMNAILNSFESSMPTVEAQTNENVDKKKKSQNRNLIWLLENHPALYFHLLDGMNGALATGHLSLGNSNISKVSAPATYLQPLQTRLLPPVPGSPKSNQADSEQGHADSGGEFELDPDVLTGDAFENSPSLGSVEPYDLFMGEMEFLDADFLAPPTDMTPLADSDQSTHSTRGWISSMPMEQDEDDPGEDESQYEGWRTDALLSHIGLFGE